MPQTRTTKRKERRATARAEARLSMRLEGRRDGAVAQVVTESQNISASGVYCLSSHFLAPLSKVDLAIVLHRLPGGRGTKDIVSCEGIVVRCDPVGRPGAKGDHAWQLACMFTDLDARRRERIADFVTWRNLQALRDATGNGRAAARAVRSATRALDGASKRGRAQSAKRAPASRRTAGR